MEAGGLRLEAGGWKARGWKLDTWKCELDIGSWNSKQKNKHKLIKLS